MQLSETSLDDLWSSRQTNLLLFLQADACASTGPMPRVFWNDVGLAALQQPSQQLAIPRLKRSMMDSPFAGSASKRPFSKRDFESIPEPPPILAKEEPSSLPTVQEEDITTDNLFLRLPSIPAIVTTSTYMQASLSMQGCNRRASDRWVTNMRL